MSIYTMHQIWSLQGKTSGSLTSSLFISCLITSPGSILFASDCQLLRVIKPNQQTRRQVVRTWSQRKALFSGNLPRFTFSLCTGNEVGRRDFSSLSAIFRRWRESVAASWPRPPSLQAARPPSPNYLHQTGWAGWRWHAKRAQYNSYYLLAWSILFQCLNTHLGWVTVVQG